MSRVSPTLAVLLAAAFALDWQRLRRSRRCCVLAALMMPVALVGADLLVDRLVHGAVVPAGTA